MEKMFNDDEEGLSLPPHRYNDDLSVLRNRAVIEQFVVLDNEYQGAKDGR